MLHYIHLFTSFQNNELVLKVFQKYVIKTWISTYSMDFNSLQLLSLLVLIV